MTTTSPDLRVPTSADVAAAAERIAPHVRRTPLIRGVVDGRPLALKLEQLQLTGSFKLRGAVNALLSGPRPQQVVTASGGNHGIGVATAAALLGLPARVHLPAAAPPDKLRRIQAAGAEVVLHDGGYAQAAEAALAESTGAGIRFVHAYNELPVVAAQGTVGAEIVADAPEVDSVLVAVGGGGLAAGISVAIGRDRELVAVEPEHCCCLHEALAAGHPVDSTVDSVAASALGALRAGELPLRVLQQHPVRSELVSDPEILAARDRLWEEFRLAVEPAAAVPFAAWLAGQTRGEYSCIVICGANSAWTPA